MVFSLRGAMPPCEHLDRDCPVARALTMWRHPAEKRAAVKAAKPGELRSHDVPMSPHGRDVERLRLRRAHPVLCRRIGPGPQFRAEPGCGLGGRIADIP